MNDLIRRVDLLGCFFCHRVEPIVEGTYQTFSFPIAGIVPVCERCIDHADLPEPESEDDDNE